MANCSMVRRSGQKGDYGETTVEKLLINLYKFKISKKLIKNITDHNKSLRFQERESKTKNGFVPILATNDENTLKVRSSRRLTFLL